jgi:N-acetylglucosamine-6-sulfatase
MSYGRGSLLAVVGILVALAIAAGPADARQRPNVLMLMTDDQTVESMRVLGNVKSLLADRGTTFENNFVDFSLCCPSRATYLTGQYAHNHGVLSNSAPSGGYGKLDGRETLPVWLQRAGYHTVHLGKYLNGYGRTNPTEIPPGWTEWYGSVDPSTYRYYGYTLNENGRLVTYPNTPANYQTDVYASKAVGLVKRLAPSHRPFFLSVAFLAPHSGGPQGPEDEGVGGTPEPAPRHQHAFDSEPLPRPPSFDEADVSDKPLGIRSRNRLSANQISDITERYRQRLESLLAVDEAVAGIVNALEQTSELGDTLILFTSDNGFFHGEHRVPQGKVLVYEPSIRVPLVMRGPGVPHGKTLDQLVSNVDLAPTILAAAHAKPERVLDGRSLRTLLRDPQVEFGRDLLIESGTVGTKPRPANNQTFAAVRSAHFLDSAYGNGETELYDLQRDPFELTSAHANPAYAGIRSSLATRLARLRTCRGPVCRARPAVGLDLDYAHGRRGCARGGVRAEIYGAVEKVAKVVLYADGDRAARDTTRPFRQRISRRELGRGVSKVRAWVQLSDDRVVTLDKHVRACR